MQYFLKLFKMTRSGIVFHHIWARWNVTGLETLCTESLHVLTYSRLMAAFFGQVKSQLVMQPIRKVLESLQQG